MRTRPTFAALLFLLTFAWMSHAATEFAVPEQSIVGADKTVPLGELVELNVSAVVTKPEHYLSSAYRWKVYDPVNDPFTGTVRLVEKKYKEMPGGSSVYFASGVEAKRLVVICFVTHLYAVKEGDAVKEIATRTSILTAELVIGNPAPPTPPTPDPALPEGRFGLAKFTCDAVTAKVKPDAVRARAAKALANSFRSVASAAAAGTISSPEDMLRKTRSVNDDALTAVNGTVESWSGFTVALQDRLYDLYTSGKIKTVPDYADAWKEIATGLDAVK